MKQNHFRTYHEQEQQQHQQRQHGLCDWGRFSGPPIFGAPCVAAAVAPPPPLPCDEPRSRQLERCNSDTLHDIMSKTSAILMNHIQWAVATHTGAVKAIDICISNFTFFGSLFNVLPGSSHTHAPDHTYTRGVEKMNGKRTFFWGNFFLLFNFKVTNRGFFFFDETMTLFASISLLVCR